MRFTAQEIAGLYRVELDPIEDDRGHFARAWCVDEFAKAGIDVSFVQANVARSKNRGTVRGLHFQLAPAEEAKLIRCTTGRIFDVVVDVRTDSATFGNWYGQVLDSEAGNMLYIPEGCAHGYQTLEDDTDVHYMVSSRYAPQLERGILWNDPQLGIEWPIAENISVSAKDLSLPTLAALDREPAHRNQPSRSQS